MKNKKGVQTVVAWVLILGFSITLGVIVFLWSTRITKEMTGNTKDWIEGGMLCENVQLYAFFTPVEGDPSCRHLSLANRGYQNITRIKVNAIDKNTKKTHSFEIRESTFVPVSPKSVTTGETSGWPTDPSNVRFELIPMVNTEKGIRGCSEKKIVVEC